VHVAQRCLVWGNGGASSRVRGSTRSTFSGSPPGGWWDIMVGNPNGGWVGG
jgi:hypothetical protein